MADEAPSDDASLGPAVSERGSQHGGAESEPPDAQPVVVDGAAADAGTAAPAPALQHPLWTRAAGGAAAAAAAGRASGRGVGVGVVNGTSAGSGGGGGAQRAFRPLSAKVLEQQRRDALGGDGASVQSDEDDEDADVAAARRQKRRRTARPAADDDEQRSEHANGEAGGDEEEARAVGGTSDDEDDRDGMARAAFGGGGGGGGGRGAGAAPPPRRRTPGAGAGGEGGGRSCCTALSQLSDSEADSLDSVAIARARREAFPIHGVKCVGCALPNRVTMIDDFVRVSSARMSEAALYKTAALIFQRDIREPAEKEGVSIPGWAWQDIAMHYSIHIVDPRHQRQEDLRSLSTVRKHLEDNLMRVDTETGEQSLDKDNAKLLLAVIAASEKNIDAQQRDNLGLAAGGGGGNSKTKRTNSST